MLDLRISNSIKNVLPDIRLGCVHAIVKVCPSSGKLLGFIERIVKEIMEGITIEQVSQLRLIAETKDAYRKLGKDPSRYRPSAEALTRRIVQGKGLYRVNNIVDALNALSIRYGFSIGGYDLEKIDPPVELGIGGPSEPYDAIGRGALNIENLPILRDMTGAFGSPTSDSQRTMVRDNTHSFLMVYFDFKSSGKLKEVLLDTRHILEEYCGVTEIETKVYL